MFDLELRHRTQRSYVRLLPSRSPFFLGRRGEDFIQIKHTLFFLTNVHEEDITFLLVSFYTLLHHRVFQKQ
jgi:hypothetical protein